MGKTIRKMAVVGAGTMGAAIAACGARAGLDVTYEVLTERACPHQAEEPMTRLKSQ